MDEAETKLVAKQQQERVTKYEQNDSKSKKIGPPVLELRRTGLVDFVPPPPSYANVTTTGSSIPWSKNGPQKQ
jgi:hypothetical protein